MSWDNPGNTGWPAVNDNNNSWGAPPNNNAWVSAAVSQRCCSGLTQTRFPQTNTVNQSGWNAAGDNNWATGGWSNEAWQTSNQANGGWNQFESKAYAHDAIEDASDNKSEEAWAATTHDEPAWDFGMNLGKDQTELLQRLQRRATITETSSAKLILEYPGWPTVPMKIKRVVV